MENLLFEFDEKKKKKSLSDEKVNSIRILISGRSSFVAWIDDLLWLSSKVLKE